MVLSLSKSSLFNFLYDSHMHNESLVVNDDTVIFSTEKIEIFCWFSIKFISSDAVYSN
jgi:hypothetical protein